MASSTLTTFVRDDFDPEWLQIEQVMGGRQTLPVESPEQSRQRFDGIFAMIAPLLPPPTDAVQTSDTTVPATGLKIRIYKPKSSQDSSSSLPVGMYIHSGGFYSGSIENEDSLVRNLCEHSNIILYSPEYRLAPEHPYPAGHNDVYAAYEFMVQSASEHGGDASKRFVMGGSAGGGFTASVCLKYARDSNLRASGAVILCPAAVHPEILRTVYKDRYQPELYDDAPMIGNDTVQQAWKWLGAPPEDPLASVVLHPDIGSLGPIYIAATTKDPTFPETMFFAEKCRESGVDVDVVEWKGFPHFFHIIPSPTAAKFMATWNEKLRAMMAKA